MSIFQWLRALAAEPNRLGNHLYLPNVTMPWRELVLREHIRKAEDIDADAIRSGGGRGLPLHDREMAALPLVAKLK